jgi:hypothetical protein
VAATNDAVSLAEPSEGERPGIAVLEHWSTGMLGKEFKKSP